MVVSGCGPHADADRHMILTLRRAQNLPVWLRCALSAAVVLAFYQFREGFSAYFAQHLFSLLILAIITVSFAFGRGMGFFATPLAALLSTGPFTAIPHAVSTDAGWDAWLSLWLFVLIGFAGAG